MSIGNTSTITSPIMTENNVVKVLVVDDDKICLAVTASVLKLFNYEVVTTNCPLEALSSLRMNNDAFDLILSDVHMPLMNGLNFQRIVEVEFQIPVILMSADDKRNLLMRSLENGAAFFIVKPPSINDLKNIWQYVISRRKSASPTSLAKDDAGPFSNSNIENNNNNNNNSPNTTSYVNNNLSSDHNNNQSQRQSSMTTGVSVESSEGKSSSGNNPKKPKLIWTTALHNKFLEAISVIGTGRAVPKKILEYMNIPGLTRENIASHLQKYRIYLRRLNESNGTAFQHGMPLNWNERPFRSSFSWNQFPSLGNNNSNYLLKYSNSMNNPNLNLNQQGMMMNHSPTQHTYGQIGENLGFSTTNNPNSYLGSHSTNSSYFQQQNLFLPSQSASSSINNNNNNNNNIHLSRSVNILESSALDAEDLGNHFSRKPLGMSPLGREPESSQYNFNMFETNNDEYNRPHHMIASQPGFRGPPLSQPYLFDGGAGLPRNTNFVMQSNFSNNKGSISTDQRRDTNISTNNGQIDTTSNVNDNGSIIIASKEQVVVGGDNANPTLQTRVADHHDKDMSTFTSTSTAAPQHADDWASNHMDDLSMVLQEYEEDLSTIFTNADAQNGNNNNK